MSALRYLELFAGAGGLSLGLDAAGLTCAGHAEIEPHARAVLRRHWPGVPLLADVRDVRGADWDVVLVSGGSPCVDLSVAGKRAGINAPRSGLFFEQIRVWEESRAPYLLWENVVGALSSNAGADFAAVLSAIVGAAVPVPADGWRSGGVVAGRTGVAAWRVLDLQWFGPPQRRRRVFVLGARAGGVDPAAVLLECESVCRHPAPRRDAGEGAAAGARGRAGEARGVVGTLNAAGAGTRRPAGQANEPDFVIVDPIPFDTTQITSAANRSNPRAGDTDHPLAAGAHPPAIAFPYNMNANAPVETGGIAGTLTREGPPAVPERPAADAIAFHHTQDPISGAVTPRHGVTADGMGVLSFDWQKGNDVNNPRASTMNVHEGRTDCLSATRVPAVLTIAGESVTHALTSGGADASEDGTGRGTPIVLASGQANAEVSESVCPTLSLLHEAPIALDVQNALTSSEVFATMDTGDAKGNRGPQVLASVPRRLMPVECERLMSWPDGHTADGLDEDGRSYRLSDAARYKLCGNGVGSVVAEWIGRRLADAHAHLQATEVAA